MSQRKKPAPAPPPKRPTYGYQAAILPFGTVAAWRLDIGAGDFQNPPRKPPEWFLTLHDTGEQRRGLKHCRPRPLAGGVFVVRTDLESPEAFACCAPLHGSLAADWKAARGALREFSKLHAEATGGRPSLFQTGTAA